MALPLTAATARAMRIGAGAFRNRWAVQEDPDVLVACDDEPIHSVVARCLDVSRSLLRASARLHNTLARAGFAHGQPVRRINCEASRTQLTDGFLLGLDNARLQGCLRLTIEETGELSTQLFLETVVDSDSQERPTYLFFNSQSLGRLKWDYAELSPNRYSKAKVLEMFEHFGFSNSSVLCPRAWTTEMLDTLVP